MTRLRTTVLAAGCTALLSLSACTGDGDRDSGGFRPHPPKSDSTTGRPAPSSENADAPETESSESSESSAAPVPTYLYPNGQEVQLTTPGTTLSFGDKATVATADEEGRLLVWSVTLYDGVHRTRDQVSLVDTAVADRVDHYRCYAYDIAFLGAVPRFVDDSVVLTAVPDLSQAVPVPMMVPVTEKGLNANQVVGNADEGCGIPASNRLPVAENDLVPDHAYARGVLSYVPTDPSRGGAPVGVRFDYSGGVPGASTDLTTPASVNWR